MEKAGFYSAARAAQSSPIWRVVKELLAWSTAAVPTTIGVLLRRHLYKFWLRSAGRKLTIVEGVTITGFENISLGHQVSIMKHSYLYAEDGELLVGNYVSINSNVQLGASKGRIVIGNGCLIGPNCVLRAADHCFSDPDKAIREQGHQGGEIILEDDVWLASNVVVTRDVRIGKGSVIGAQSVVTHDIPPYSIVHGVPANVVRSRR